MSRNTCEKNTENPTKDNEPMIFPDQPSEATVKLYQS